MGIRIERALVVVLALLFLLPSLSFLNGQLTINADDRTADDEIIELQQIEHNNYHGQVLQSEGRVLNSPMPTRTAPYESWWHDPQPSARDSHWMTYDHSSDSTFVFGGYSIDYSNDLYRFDHTSGEWEELVQTSRPDKRINFAMTIDDARHEIYIWGGIVYGVGLVNDMWKYNITLNTWTQVTQSNTPSAREQAQMTYYYNSDELVLYGGIDGSGSLVEMWYFGITNRTWYTRGTVDGQNRYGHSMVIDQDNELLYVYGGWNWATGLSDTFLEIDVTDPDIYSIITTASNPGQVRDAAIGLDRSGGNNYLYLFGGYDVSFRNSDLWIYDFNSLVWTQLGSIVNITCPDNRSDFSYCHDPQNGRLHLFGGWGDNNVVYDDLWAFDYSTRTWALSTPVPERPQSRSGASLVYSPVRHGFYYFGGRTRDWTNDTWFYDIGSGRWHEVAPTTSPPRRAFYAMAYDPVNEGMYLFGGDTPDSLDWHLNDLWWFNDTTQDWSSLDPPTPRPPARMDLGCAVDPATGEFYIFGGGNDTVKEFNDLWKYNRVSNTWTNVPDINPPLKRRGHGMAVDPRGGGFYVFGGGYDDGLGYLINQETFRYDFSTRVWTLLNPPSSPPHTFRTSMTSGNGNLYLYGGFGLGAFNWQKDLFVFNVTSKTWSTSSKQGNDPGGRAVVGMAHNPKEGDVYVIDGLGSGGSLWKYGLPYDIGLDMDYNGQLINYAGMEPVKFAVNITHPFDIDLITEVNLTFDPGVMDLSITLDPVSGNFIGHNLNGYITSIDQGKFEIQNNVLHIDFIAAFDWSFPTGNTLDVRIETLDSNGYSEVYTVSDLFKVETRLEFDGTLRVNSQHHGTISTGATLLPGEYLEWTGFQVVYADGAGVYPPDDQFDVEIVNGQGAQWIDADSSGRDVLLNITMQDDSITMDRYFVNLSGPAAAFNPLSMAMDLSVDAESIQFSDLGPIEEGWLKKSKVEFTSTITDLGGGKVDASTIEYNLYPTDGQLGNWTSAGLSDDLAEITAKQLIDLDDGIHSIIWRAGDVVGNQVETSEEISVKIDTEPVSYSEISPIAGTTFDTNKVNVSITFTDNTSGIDPATVKYQTSTDDGGSYSNWTTVPNSGGTQFTATIPLTLPEGTNLFRWQALDIAGNIGKVPDPLTIIIKLPEKIVPPPVVTLTAPENGSKVETLRPTLSWTTDYQGEDTVHYKVLINTEPNFIGIIPFQKDTTSTKVVLPYALDDGTDYFWTVIPFIDSITGGCANGFFSLTTHVNVDVVRKVQMVVETTDIRIDQGQTMEVNITLNNIGDLMETVSLKTTPKGDGPDMLIIEPNSIDVRKGQSETVILTIEAAEDCPKEIFKYTLTAQYEVETLSVELTVVVDDGLGGDDDDDTTSNSGIVVALGIIFVLLFLVILLVIFLVMRSKKQKDKPTADPKADTKEKQKAPVKEKEPEPEEEPIYDDSDRSEAYSGSVVEAEVAQSDIFQEAAFHKGYDAAKQKQKGSEEVVDGMEWPEPPPMMDDIDPSMELPPREIDELDKGPQELKGWDLGADVDPYKSDVDLEDIMNPQKPVLALPPAIFVGADQDKSKPYHIDDVLVMDSNGILVSHYSAGTSLEVDEDILAGMLTAIQSFVKDSFKLSGGGLSDVSMGEYHLCIAQGKHLNITAIVSGDYSTTIRKQIDKAIVVAEVELGDQLENWSGDMGEITGLEEIIRDFLEGKFE